MKPNIIANKDRTPGILWLYTAIFCLLLTSSAYSDAVTNRPIDFVVFFKQAISAPPDVSNYVAGLRNLQLSRHHPDPAQTNSFQYFQGARSGTNFFLCQLLATNSSLDTNQGAVVTGRAGTSQYGIGGKLVTHIIGSNAASVNVSVLFNLTRQFLDMGASEIEPETVEWEGNKFTAKSNRGKVVHGKLEVSNELPFKMEISQTNGSPPYKVIEYTYPIPPTLLSGFPAKMAITAETDGALKPVLELTFEQVQLATQKLSEDFFSDARFSERIKYTNIFSNSDLYVYNTKHTNLIKTPGSLLKSGGYTNSNTRIIVYLGLALTSIVPLVILLSVWFKQNKKTN